MKSFVSFTKAVLFALVCLGMSGTLPAEDYLNGQLTITPLPQPTTRTSSSSRTETVHGYVEYRFHVNNKSNQPHRVTFTFGGSAGYGGTVMLNHASTTVVAEPNSEATATILQPPIAFTYYTPQLEIRIDNAQAIPTSYNATPHGNQHHYYGGPYSSGSASCNILVSNKITANQRELLTRGTLEEEKPPESETPGGMTGGMGTGGMVMVGPPVVDTHNVWQSEIPTDQWSDQWLSYTRFDCVVVNNDDLNVLKPEAFRALRRYVEMGGMFVVLDARSTQPPNWPKHWIEVPKLFRAVPTETQASEYGSDPAHAGEHLPPELAELTPLTPTGLTHYQALQGEAYVMSGGDNEESCIKHLREVAMNVTRRYNNIMSFAEGNAEHFEHITPLGISYAIPVRALVVLVISWAINPSPLFKALNT
jgi:hypothetical protein